MPLVKKLAAKHLQHTESRASDYETHCAVVVACKTKSSFGKLVQEQLDQRFQNEVRAVQSLKTREALWAHWTEHKEAANFPGVFWSVLSHPRCDAAMEFEVLGHAHMLQHQAGCERQTHEQHKTTLQEQLKAALAGNKKLEEKYLALQNTHTQTQQRQQETISALQTELASQQGEMQKLQLALSMAKTTPKHSSSDLAAEIEIMRARVSSLKAAHQLELSSFQARVK